MKKLFIIILLICTQQLVAQNTTGNFTIDFNLGLKANLASPTFTGTVVLPASTTFTTPIALGALGGGWKIGNYDATYGALHSNNVTPSTSNYALISNGASTFLNSTATVYVAVNDGIQGRWNTTGLYVGGNVAPTSWLHLAAGSTSKSPLRFTSGALPTGGNILAGNFDFLTDKWYGTITTGTAQKEITMNDAALTSGTVPVATTNGRLTDGLIIAATTYTPTLTNVANVAASTAYSCQYSRVGNTVTVSGEVDIDPTTTLTLTQLGVSLPIASALANSNELAGTSADELGTPARVAGDVTNDRAEVRLTPVDVTNRRFSFTFTYRII